MSKVLEPEYYGRFACLMGNCKYTCCQEWDIALTRADYTKMRSARVGPELKQAAELGFKRIKKNATDQNYAMMVLDEHRYCYFLGEGGMCRLQQQCGAGVLSDVCKRFPRNALEMPGSIQRCCSTGCEQVVNLLLEAKDGLHFVEREDATEKPLIWQDKFKHPEQYGVKLYFFEEVQALCIAILQNRACTLEDRVILLGLALKDYDAAAAADEVSVRDWLTRWRMLATSEGAQAARELLAELPTNPKLSALNSLMFAKFMTENKSYTVYPQMAKVAFRALGAQFFANEGADEENLKLDAEQYQKTMAFYAEQMRGLEHLMENVLVNYLFHEKIPYTVNKTVWEFYLAFCCMYSFIRTMAAGYLAENPGVEHYVHAITVCSRRLFHSTQWQQLAVARFRETDTDTLAHMAMLVRG